MRSCAPYGGILPADECLGSTDPEDSLVWFSNTWIWTCKRLLLAARGSVGTGAESRICTYIGKTEQLGLNYDYTPKFLRRTNIS
jgi:hypothetical protein